MDAIQVHLIFLLISPIFYDFSAAAGGQWTLLHATTGVSAMHMQLLHNDRVIIFDRTDFGKSNLSLPNGKCRHDPREVVLKVDCTAHSIEYDVQTNTFRPLMVLTDTWCSSGTVDPNGILVQTGGFNDGDRAVRKFSPCNDKNCDWNEINPGLSARRWYATNQILPDGRAVVIGGRGQFNYEFYPKSDKSYSGPINLPFLFQTYDKPAENNLYPFVHLNVDGNLFVFSNNRAILLDYKRNAIVKNYPVMPGGDPRNYPSSGSSVLLPLSPSGIEAEVMICGGAPKGSFEIARSKRAFMDALATCGRIKITDNSPSWFMEKMPMARVMGDMILLPTGQVLIINGAGAGTAGWEYGQKPVTSPVMYSPNAVGSRFSIQNPSKIPRLYHSSAILLRDGRILVGGSNPHIYYEFYGVQYPTELSLEAFSPDYLNYGYSKFRPKIVETTSPLELSYGEQFKLQFTLGILDGQGQGVYVTMIAPPFTTHSFSMNQRLLLLKNSRAVEVGKANSLYEIGVTAPVNGFMAPSGYYMLFVCNAGIPSEGIWVHVN